MRVFAGLYDRVLSWSARERSDWYLGGLSAAESVVFPVPVEVLLVPMVLARPSDWARLALIATIASVAGGILGYAIGFWAWEWIGAWQDEAQLLQVKEWFGTWGAWVVFAAAFSPVPYKVFTITAGFLSVSFFPFLIASLLGRGARFYLVARLTHVAGPAAEPWIRRHVEMLGWLLLAALALLWAMGVWG